MAGIRGMSRRRPVRTVIVVGEGDGGASSGRRDPDQLHRALARVRHGHDLHVAQRLTRPHHRERARRLQGPARAERDACDTRMDKQVRTTPVSNYALHF